MAKATAMEVQEESVSGNRKDLFFLRKQVVLLAS